MKMMAHAKARRREEKESEVQVPHDFAASREETLFGSLPSDWQAFKIGDVTVRTKQRDPRREPTKRFRYVDVSSVSNSSFRIVEAAEMKGSAAPSRARKEIRTSDVLFATVRPTLKRVALVPSELDGDIASTGYIVLRANPDKLCPRYLYSHLLTDVFIKRMAELERGASYPAVRDTDVLNEIIPLPPLPEQRKIAGVLGLVQKAMEEQERLMALIADLKKTILHQLFTQGLRGEPQKQTEIGPVPVSWAVKPLGDYLTEAQYGISAKGAEIGRYAVLRMTNQQQGKISGDNLQYVELTPVQFAKFRVERQDILFNRTNSLELVGRTAIFDLDGDFVFASYLIRLRTNMAQLRPSFLNHYFNYDEIQVRLKSIATRAVSQSNISATRLRGFPVPVPPPEEQDKIISHIDCLDRKLTGHRRKYVTLTNLFRTLLHQLMTAQIRVDTLDLAILDNSAEKFVSTKRQS